MSDYDNIFSASNNPLISNPLVSALTSEQFQQWLESKQSDELVGCAATCSGCPVANYLKEVGFDCPNVAQDYVKAQQSQKLYYCYAQDNTLIPRMPNWVSQFVSRIDIYYGSSGRLVEHAVYAAGALKVLGEIIEQQ